MAKNRLHERSPAEIEEDLEQTRRQISRTIDAIQSKMTPGQVFQEFYDRARGGPTDYVRNLGLAAKNNPIPLALVGVGITWLATSGGRTPSYLRGAHEPGYGSDEPAGSGTLRDAAVSAKGYMRSAGEYGSAVAQATADIGSEARDKAGAYASGVADSAGKLATGTAESVRRMAEDARNLATEWREGAANAGSQSRERARQVGHMAQEKAAQVWHDQPLVVGALGLALGALLGALMPSTEREDAIMGETRDRLVDQARTAGAGALHEATEAATDIAREAAKSVESRTAADTGRTDFTGSENEGTDQAPGVTPSDRMRAR
jgi:Protein of unknown function (DUF3618)